MRVQSIELEGFRSWRARRVIDLSGMSLVGIVGANRAGKTSLLTAIEFALWGSTRGASVNDVINRHAKAARVTLQFETLGHTYRIERTRTRAGRHEVLFCTADPTAPTGWRELAEKHPSVADPVIVATMGMDEQTSALTWLVRQNDYGAFCTLTPTARRQALVTAFGLDRYTALAERADELRRTAERDLDQHRWTVENLTTQLDAARHEVEQAGDPTALQAEADRLAGELDQVAAQLAGPAETARRARADLERLHADHATAVQEVDRKPVWLRRQRDSLSSRLESARGGERVDGDGLGSRSLPSASAQDRAGEAGLRSRLATGTRSCVRSPGPGRPRPCRLPARSGASTHPPDQAVASCHASPCQTLLPVRVLRRLFEPTRHLGVSIHAASTPGPVVPAGRE